MNKRILILIAVLFLLYGFERENKTVLAQKGDEKMATGNGLTVTSTAFKESEMMPSKYTCDGQNISLPLKWHNAPDGTKSFALISDDPDAPMGIWVHWVMWNIPAEKNELHENMPQTKETADGARQGLNSSHLYGYTGPCPPSGTHRYYFKIYALDTKLQLTNDVTKSKLLEAMEGHILEESFLMGKYKRK